MQWRHVWACPVDVKWNVGHHGCCQERRTGLLDGLAEFSHGDG